MSAPTVYLDECVNHALLPYLDQRGFLVRTAQGAGMSGAADEDQIRHAHANNWLLLTVNEKDFIMWHRTFLGNGWTQVASLQFLRRQSFPASSFAVQ
jgi:hypothetical protein